MVPNSVSYCDGMANSRLQAMKHQQRRGRRRRPPPPPVSTTLSGRRRLVLDLDLGLIVIISHGLHSSMPPPHTPFGVLFSVAMHFLGGIWIRLDPTLRK